MSEPSCGPAIYSGVHQPRAPLFRVFDISLRLDFGVLVLFGGLWWILIRETHFQHALDESPDVGLLTRMLRRIPERTFGWPMSPLRRPRKVSATFKKVLPRNCWRRNAIGNKL